MEPFLGEAFDPATGRMTLAFREWLQRLIEYTAALEARIAALEP